MTSVDADQIALFQQSTSLKIQSHETNLISDQAFEVPPDREDMQMDLVVSDANQQIIPQSTVVAKKKRSGP